MLNRQAGRLKQDKRIAIRSDHNNAADPDYIVRLVAQVVRLNPSIPAQQTLLHRYAP